jgi:hypothetical protein
MPAPDDQIGELQHAYQVLGVAHPAPAHVIKAAYRKLVKRWHPDLYAAGPAHAEATQMTILINQAYSAVAHAPLRYRSSSTFYERISSAPPSRQNAPARWPTNFKIDPLAPRVDRLEFWVRFVCGALFGIFSGAWVLSDMTTTAIESPVTAVAGVVALAARFGLAAARYGDKFWYSALSSGIRFSSGKTRGQHRILPTGKKLPDAAYSKISGRSARCDTPIPSTTQRCVAASAIRYTSPPFAPSSAAMMDHST